MMVRPTRSTFAHCYWCNRTFQGIPERKYERGRRVVAFCTSKCFRSYLLSNFVPRNFSIRDRDGVSSRLDRVITDLKAESIFLPDTSPKKVVDEEMIYFLMFIRDGREQVTCHERMCQTSR